MKMLVLADIHEEGAVLDRMRAAGKGEYGVVLIAGDTSNHSVSFMEDMLGIFPDAYIIPGNNERAEVMEVLRKARNYAHGKRFELEDGHNIVGFGFSNPTPFGTPGELGEDEIYAGLSRLEIDERTILLVHAPPHGLLDEIKGMHVGSKSIRRIIEERQPLVVFCGHLHEVTGVERLGKTLVVNVPAAQNWKFCAAEVSGEEVSAEFREMK